MRTAICLSGELRSLDQTISMFEKNIFKHLESYDAEYDIFYFGWKDDPDISKLKYLVHNGNLRDLELEDRITLNEDFYFPNKPVNINYQAILRQLYCLKRANDLKTSFETKYQFEYTKVIRLRPDLLFTTIKEYSSFLGIDSQLHILDHDEWHGYPDRFYFGSSEVMNLVSNRLDLLPLYSKIGGRNHYEGFFQFVADYYHIDTNIVPDFRTCLLRTNGDKVGELISIENGEIEKKEDGRIWHNKLKCFI